MYVLEKIRRELENQRHSGSGRIFERLVNALEREEDFPLHQLYTLNYAQFQLAMELLNTWRLGRYCHKAVPPDAPDAHSFSS